MAGFKIAGRLSGGAPTIITVKAKDTETLSNGDIANVESGQADLGATADTALAGPIVSATVSATTAVTDIQICIDPDVILEVTDNNARLVGATLDLSGATGAQGVTTSSNKEFIVVSASTATQPTRVMFNTGRHLLNKAQ
jgi:methionine aminopeptidase